MNLWTVGCADPRLTAPARSPMDKPGKRHAFPPPCPQVGGCPQAPPLTNKSKGCICFRERRNLQPATSLSLFFPEAVLTSGTAADHGLACDFSVS